MIHLIFDYNFGTSRYISIIFASLETGMNILSSRYKLFYFNLIMSPLYLIKLKIAPKTAARLLRHSVAPIVPKFNRKSFNVRFFACLLEHSFSSLPTKDILHSLWFYQKIIFKLNMVNFNM